MRLMSYQYCTAVPYPNGMMYQQPMMPRWRFPGPPMHCYPVMPSHILVSQPPPVYRQQPPVLANYNRSPVVFVTSAQAAACYPMCVTPVVSPQLQLLPTPPSVSIVECSTEDELRDEELVTGNDCNPTTSACSSSMGSAVQLASSATHRPSSRARRSLLVCEVESASSVSEDVDECKVVQKSKLSEKMQRLEMRISKCTVVQEVNESQLHEDCANLNDKISAINKAVLELTKARVLSFYTVNSHCQDQLTELKQEVAEQIANQDRLRAELSNLQERLTLTQEKTKTLNEELEQPVVGRGDLVADAAHRPRAVAGEVAVLKLRQMIEMALLSKRRADAEQMCRSLETILNQLRHLIVRLRGVYNVSDLLNQYYQCREQWRSALGHIDKLLHSTPLEYSNHIEMLMRDDAKGLAELPDIDLVAAKIPKTQPLPKIPDAVLEALQNARNARSSDLAVELSDESGTAHTDSTHHLPPPPMWNEAVMPVAYNNDHGGSSTANPEEVWGTTTPPPLFEFDSPPSPVDEQRNVADKLRHTVRQLIPDVQSWEVMTAFKRMRNNAPTRESGLTFGQQLSLSKLQDIGETIVDDIRNYRRASRYSNRSAANIVVLTEDNVGATEMVSPESAVASDRGCAVCLEMRFVPGDGAEDVVRCRNCENMFHQECLEGWLKRNRTCPTCRQLLYLSDEFPCLAAK